MTDATQRGNKDMTDAKTKALVQAEETAVNNFHRAIDKYRNGRKTAADRIAYDIAYKTWENASIALGEHCKANKA